MAQQDVDQAGPDCICETPTRPTEYADPSICATCRGFACEYAEKGQTRCPSWRCDCFIETHPDSPMTLHPEAFTVSLPSAGTEQVLVVVDEPGEPEDGGCWHDWMLRPESDTHVCLVCGAEA